MFENLSPCLVSTECALIRPMTWCHQDIFDILNSMIYDLKRSVDLRLLFDPVLHSPLDDLIITAYHIVSADCLVLL